jgi:hypothetical protein
VHSGKALALQDLMKAETSQSSIAGQTVLASDLVRSQVSEYLMCRSSDRRVQGIIRLAPQIAHTILV